MPERRRDDGQRDRLDEIQSGYEKWTSRTIVLLGILVVIQLGLGALSVYLLGQNNRRANEGKHLAQRIQASRADATRITCRDQNARHDDTIHKLDVVLERAARPASAQRRRRLIESRASTVLLINALAPHQNCAKRVRQLTGSETGSG